MDEPTLITILILVIVVLISILVIAMAKRSYTPKSLPKLTITLQQDIDDQLKFGQARIKEIEEMVSILKQEYNMLLEKDKQLMMVRKAL